MATLQKLKPCPKCKTDEHLAIFTYESGWRHVECNKCFYFGPGKGSKREAVAAYNNRVGTVR